MLQGTVYTVPSSAVVDIIYANNTTLLEAFQFGLSTDTWTLTGQNFKMEFKASRDDVAPLLTITSGAGEIVVDDVTNRVIHLNVPDTTMTASLPVGQYVYDLIMYDNSVPAVRTMLMQGCFYVRQGVTED